MSDIRSETQPAFFDTLGDQFGETRLIKRDLPFLKLLDSSAVGIHAGDLDAEFGKTGSGDESDVTTANYTDVHDPLLMT